jgi:hypothetical protein
MLAGRMIRMIILMVMMRVQTRISQTSPCSSGVSTSRGDDVFLVCRLLMIASRCVFLDPVSRTRLLRYELAFKLMPSGLGFFFAQNMLLDQHKSGRRRFFFKLGVSIIELLFVLRFSQKALAHGSCSVWPSRCGPTVPALREQSVNATFVDIYSTW